MAVGVAIPAGCCRRATACRAGRRGGLEFDEFDPGRGIVDADDLVGIGGEGGEVGVDDGDRSDRRAGTPR